MAMICEKTISGKIVSKKKCVFDRHQRSKEAKFPTKLLIFSRKYPVAEKLEQLEQNRKKYLKAHSMGYQRLPIGFELQSVFKVKEVIKGQNNDSCENSFS